MKAKKANVTVLFRQLNEPVPDNWVAGLRYQVEAHSLDFDLPFPIGLAWVMVPPPGGPLPPGVEFVIVLDQFRRLGVATALIEAIENQWPNVWLTDAISDAGAGLIAALEGRKPA